VRKQLSIQEFFTQKRVIVPPLCRKRLPKQSKTHDLWAVLIARIYEVDQRVNQ
jgi:hypothetical protein